MNQPKPTTPVHYEAGPSNMPNSRAVVPSYPKPKMLGAPATTAPPHSVSTRLEATGRRREMEGVPVQNNANNTFAYIPSSVHQNIPTAWWNMYDALCDYKNRHGHCNIPEHSQSQPLLAEWVKYQRKQYQKVLAGEQTLTMFQIKALERTGFVWNDQDAVWYDRYEQLRRFKQQYGHCRVAPSFNKELHAWVEDQQLQDKQLCIGKSSRLTPTRLQALQEIGLLWCMSRDLTKNPPFPLHTTDAANVAAPPKLNTTLKEQRKASTKSPGKVVTTDVAAPPKSNKRPPPVLQPPAMTPNHSPKARHKPSPPSIVSVPQGKPRQESAIPSKRSKVIAQPNPEKGRPTAKLSQADAYWYRMFEILKTFTETHGHCYVPQTGNGIENWIYTQQREYKKFVRGASAMLNQDKVAALNNLGFNWNPKESLWMSYYKELCHVKSWNNGLCRIPANYGHPELRAWVAVQRNQYEWFQKGEWSELTHRKIELLNSIGFFWNAKDEYWWNMFDRLRAFKTKNGHFNVMGHDEALLSDWLERLKMDRLPMDRVQALHRIGFSAKRSDHMAGYPPRPSRDATSELPVHIDSPPAYEQHPV